MQMKMKTLHEEANPGIEGGDLLYQILVVYRMPIVAHYGQ